MRTKLTMDLVRTAECEDGRLDIWDTEVRGFFLRVGPGGKAYYLKYRTADGTIRKPKVADVTIKGGLRAARDIARGWLEEVRRGGDPSAERKAKRKAPTVGDVADDFLEQHAKAHCKPRTVQGYETLVRLHIKPHMGSRKVETLSLADVRKWHTDIGSKGKTPRPGAANRALHLLSTIMSFAEEMGYRKQSTNPCTRVRRFPEEPVERFLEPQERARLEAEIAKAESKKPGQKGYLLPGALTVVRLLSMTGCRLGEILGLKWSMVDFDRGFLNLPDEISKTGKKVVPLSMAARVHLADLEEHRSDGTDLVVHTSTGGPLNRGNVERAWRVLRKRAELEDVRLHDLRHSAASDALMAGVPLELVGKMLGHKHLRTTQRYAHIADDVLREAVDRMGDAIEARTKAGAKVVPIARGKR